MGRGGGEGGRGAAVPLDLLSQTHKSLDYSDLQLFAILIFEVDFSETYLMTNAENSVSKPPNLKIIWGRILPGPP